MKPALQAQAKKFAEAPCEQVPPLRHGDEAHSLRSVWQVVPVKPGAQTQRYLLYSSTQVPPF